MNSISLYSEKSIAEILQLLQSTKSGLSEKEVNIRQQKYGKNEIEGKEVKWYDVFLRQFQSPFLYLLIGASLLAFLLREWIDGSMIILFVLINTLLGFYQEFRSEEALKILKKYIVAKAKVRRNGKYELVETSQLVPGDIVILEPGSRVPADMRLLETTNLTVDESILTGESSPVNKSLEKHNEVFSGTTVVAGQGEGIVLTIGKDTSIGQIAHLTIETKHESSFEKGISRFSSFILRLIIFTLVFIFLANIFIKGPQLDWIRLIIFSIALAVSVIPEALPIVTTFSLSQGALKLAKNKVVVKRLSAIEDLGGIEILCSDKTGTITENKLTVEKLYSNDEPSLLLFAGLASQSDDPFDTAIRKKLDDDHHNKIKQYVKIAEAPFDPERKRNSVVVKKEKELTLIVRGAPETILKLAKNAAIHADALKWILEKSNEGKRTIAVAVKKLDKNYSKDLSEQEQNLEFIGVISFIDPIKSTAYEAIKKAKGLGVGIKILTGDSREVAGTVAKKIGLIDDVKQVIGGDEFISLSVENQHKAVEEYKVFARTSPQQKYQIIKLLEEKHEVGFLGEGINDAPALKIANVAIVVESASDIARDTADIVLLHKSLRVIIEGITLGRQTFANTTKYIKATLSSNFGNFYTVAIASLIVSYLPLLPLQILLINLLTDFPMIAIATDSVEDTDLRNPKSYDLKEIIFLATLLGIISSFFDFMFFVLFSRISPSVLQTNWFIGSVLTELVFLFSIRTRSSIFKAARPSLPIIFFSLFAAILAIVLPFTSIGHNFFSFITPSVGQLSIIFSLVLGYFITTEIVKLLYYRSSFYKKLSG